MASTAPPPGRKGGKPKWRRGLVIAVITLVIGTSIWRAAAGQAEPAPAAPAQPGATAAPGGAAGFAPTGSGTPAPDTTAEPAKSNAPPWLPYVTEGGIAMLIGIALGVATRTLFKFVAILVALVFIAIQWMAHKGWIQGIDWKGVETWLLNVPRRSGISEIVKHKLPSAGALLAGYWIGLKRG